MVKSAIVENLKMTIVEKEALGTYLQAYEKIC